MTKATLSSGNSSRNGFVFAVTGKDYNTLAHRAAHSLRLVHPDAEIDLYTDLGTDDPVFSQVHTLSSSWFRPKMEALVHSRFARTLYLDADIMVVGNLMPVFDLLDRFDIAACHNRILNGEPALRIHKEIVPEAFCSINAGVIALRNSDLTQAFIENWQKEVKESGSDRDQPAFRELLYASDLRVWIMPPGYNLLTFLELETWSGMFSAPRLLHSPNLHKGEVGVSTKPFTIEEVVGGRHARQLRALIQADHLLTPSGDHDRTLPAPVESTLNRRLRSIARKIVRSI